MPKNKLPKQHPDISISTQSIHGFIEIIFKTVSDSKRGPADAFILFSDRDKIIVREIVKELENRRITTFFWERDVSIGEQWLEIEGEALKAAHSVVVFLGSSGWGPTHLRLAVQAQELNKPLIPVLLGDPENSGELSKANELFVDNRYLPMRQLTTEALDLLCQSIRESIPLDQIDPSAAAGPPSFDVKAEIDATVQILIDGNEEERLGVLEKIRNAGPIYRRELAGLLRLNLENDFSGASGGDPLRAPRSPDKVISIRSWMLSSLIWTGDGTSASRDCIFRHLQESSESEHSIRFWGLAALYQSRSEWTAAGRNLCSTDSRLEVRLLSEAILTELDPGSESISLFSAKLIHWLGSSDFQEKWSVLRVLRIVPFPNLVRNIIELLEPRTRITYDAFYALAHSEVAKAVVQPITQGMGLRAFIEGIAFAASSADGNALPSFSRLLLGFDREEVDRHFLEGAGDPELGPIIRKLKVQYLKQLQKLDRSQSSDMAGYRAGFSSYLPDRTGYERTPEGSILFDALETGIYANHLAQLVGAKETLMPLSLALFGPWGSGKTHFMDLLNERLSQLGHHNKEVFHRHIVQIRFNAWHYLDTNLWANLVCEIFDQLFRKLDADPGTNEEQINRLRLELTEQGALAKEAQDSLDQAELARQKAEEDLQEAVRKRLSSENTVRGMLEDLGAILAEDPQVKKDLEDASMRLGLPELKESFSALESTVAEFHSIQVRIRVLALNCFTGLGSMWGFLILLGILGLPWALGLLLEKVNLLDQMGRMITQSAGVIVAVSAWLAAQLKKGNGLLEKVEGAYQKIKIARAKRKESEATRQAKDALRENQQKEKAARHLLEEIQGRINAINVQLAELAPGRQLMRFLRERASAQDYRQHLGLVSLIRRDFEQLSDLLLKAAGGKMMELPQIDRIVLYIDDLDRCRPERVLEVLEAVHLLLAFPLFAVVVAVDPRWLRHSILQQHSNLRAERDDDQSATPQDYLEKIFQIPFNLQPMEKKGFDSLIDHLFPIQTEESARFPEIPAVAAAPVLPLGESLPVRTAQGEGAVETGSGSKPEDLSTESEHSESKVDPATFSAPERLRLSEQEVGDIRRFQPLFGTPRALKRFANTYSLVRVGVEEENWVTFLGSAERQGEYRIPMLLLAVSSSFPSISHSWLQWRLENPDAAWQAITPLRAGKADLSEEEKRLHRALLQIQLGGWPASGRRKMEEWIPRVARYSF